MKVAKRTLIWTLLSLLFVTSCANKQDTIANDDQEDKFEYSGLIQYDSCYWIYNPLVGNSREEKNIDNFFITETDTMESELLDKSKQILKDFKIKFEKKYEDTSDKGHYFENKEDAVSGAKAYITVLGNYLFSHGYKKISENEFRQRVKYFFFSDRSNENWTNEINFIDSLGPDYKDSWHCMSMKYRLYLNQHIDKLGENVDIKGAKYINDGFDPDMGEPINPRIDMESFINGELVLEGEWTDPFLNLDRVLYTHMYLFNDSKAAKIWFLNNHIDFFFDEIRSYDDDDEVNRKKLSYMLKHCTNDYGVITMNMPPEYEGPNKETLLEHGLAGRNHNMMKLIFDETDKAITKYENDESVGLNTQAFEMISEYFWEKWATTKRENSLKSSPNEIETLCMFAKMEVSLNKKHCRSRRHGWFNQECASLSYSVLSDEVLEVAKKNNYYGIPNFDEVLKVIAWDREHDPEGSKFNDSPFDYATLVTQNP